MARMSILWAAGSKPTADISEVRPPTQSYMGKVASQASDFASLSKLLSMLVIDRILSKVQILTSVGFF